MFQWMLLPSYSLNWSWEPRWVTPGLPGVSWAHGEGPLQSGFFLSVLSPSPQPCCGRNSLRAGGSVFSWEFVSPGGHQGLSLTRHIYWGPVTRASRSSDLLLTQDTLRRVQKAGVKGQRSSPGLGKLLPGTYDDSGLGLSVSKSRHQHSVFTLPLSYPNVLLTYFLERAFSITRTRFWFSKRIKS